MTPEQYARSATGSCATSDGGFRPISREHVGRPARREAGSTLRSTGGAPSPSPTVRGGGGHRVPPLPRAPADYDLDTVADITGSPPDLLERLLEDVATIRPMAIHVGEGVNHYFHATLHNRATFLVAMLTGQIGLPGSGVSTWAGNYKGGIFHAAPWFGPGVGGYVNEDPFNPFLDETTPTTSTTSATTSTARRRPTGDTATGRSSSTPGEGRKVFTGRTHMPTPTKVLWYNNANLINQAKWAYHLIKNVNPKVDMIVDQQIEWTGSAEFADIILPANSWLEFETLEMGGSCSNPFLQLWKGGIPPLYDSRDDVAIFAGVARALSGSHRRRPVRRLLQVRHRGTTRGLPRPGAQGLVHHRGLHGGRHHGRRYGEPGGALMQYRTYPRIPFWEQVKDSLPSTPTPADERLLRPPRGDRLRREPDRPPRGRGSHPLSSPT
jgi:nitrate reductase / nitrite oxidoreductase, alpha subunit